MHAVLHALHLAASLSENIRRTTRKKGRSGKSAYILIMYIGNQCLQAISSSSLAICAYAHGGNVKTERWSEHLYAVQVEGRSSHFSFLG